MFHETQYRNNRLVVREKNRFIRFLDENPMFQNRIHNYECGAENRTIYSAEFTFAVLLRDNIRFFNDNSKALRR